ncbi:Uridylate kinase [Candidatus Protochlamydia naegleriophila]|uniref:Uridylate kinase n=1 Tax=Candidatus Protochlamydia naegleriophila TaxID=389348 RepID=A0A0U5JDA1_9BACT|nr:UMP kinase [Candidatus Protochlamydia naegleriophila]CUI17848.1 Uridylate kinase [Candidatus Protochlamydia naegleriophila]
MDKGVAVKRILLKLSGETLMGDQGFGINQEACQQVAHYLHKIHGMGLQVAVVIGGGNIFRGINLRATGLPRTSADHMGMLATLLNGIALQQALMAAGAKACVMSALECPKVAESYNWGKALQYLEEGTILIFVGGTGNPYFTTDTAAALRASEIHADILFKATKVDGIYSRDPLKHSDAVKYDRISYSQVLAEKLQVMDATAIALCRSNQIPIFVFNMRRLLENDLEPVLKDFSHGTLVDDYENKISGT